jgi:hypothetical protein
MSVVVEEFYNRCHGANGRFCGSSSSRAQPIPYSKSVPAYLPIRKSALTRILEQPAAEKRAMANYIKKYGPIKGVKWLTPSRGGSWSDD